MIYTYLFREASSGLTKIGRSHAPASRFLTICKKTVGLVPVCVMPVNIEKELHHKHSEYRSHGEWFALSDKVVTDYMSHEMNAMTFTVDGNPIIPGPHYNKGQLNPAGTIVALDLTDEETARIDAIANAEKRARKNQVYFMIMEGLKIAEAEIADLSTETKTNQ